MSSIPGTWPYTQRRPVENTVERQRHLDQQDYDAQLVAYKVLKRQLPADMKLGPMPLSPATLLFATQLKAQINQLAAVNLASQNMAAQQAGFEDMDERGAFNQEEENDRLQRIAAAGLARDQAIRSSGTSGWSDSRRTSRLQALQARLDEITLAQGLYDEATRTVTPGSFTARAKELMDLENRIKYHPWPLGYAPPVSRPIEREVFLERTKETALRRIDEEDAGTENPWTQPPPENQQLYHYYDASNPRALHGYKFGDNEPWVKQ